MAINRIEYPITYDEVITFLEQEVASILADNVKRMAIGDPRPELLKWAAERLLEQRNLVRKNVKAV